MANNILTAKNISKIKSGEQLTGEGLEVRNLKGGYSYYSAIMVKGTRIRKLLGKSAHGYNLARAKRDIITLQSQLLAVDYDVTKEKFGQQNFEFVADYYIKQLQNTGGKNIAQKTQQLSQHLIPYFGKIKIGQIKTLNVDSYKHSRSLAGARPSTINAELAVLRHIYSSLKSWELLGGMPFTC